MTNRWAITLVTILLLAGLFGGCSLALGIPETRQTEDMITIPAGWFTMGQDNDRRANRPQRQIYLDAFAIDRTEVTNAAYGQYLATTEYQPDRGWDLDVETERGQEPVTGLLWHEADAYCRWMGKRLPTEAEWEKAARGTDARIYPWGDTWDSSKANTADRAQGNVLLVGSFPAGASPYGVLDMCGNAAEWVNDYFTFDYYTYGPDHNHQGPQQVLDHSLRGGSFADPAEFTTTFFRNSSHSVLPNVRVGFRCAISLPEEK